jgi:thymidylate synthase
MDLNRMYVSLWMEQYQTLLKELLVNGKRQFNERTGHLMIGKSGHQSVYDLSQGFPATTTKRLFFRGVAEELLWLARGERNVKGLVDRGIHIWDGNAFGLYVKRNELNLKKHTPEWNQAMKDYVQRIESDPEFAEKEGDLGPIYGAQWRAWTGKDGVPVDQLKDNVIKGLRKQPGTRYAILNAYKVDELKDMSLPACHAFAQFNIWEDNILDVNMFQRSCDAFLGVPFNTASYPLLASLVAKELDLNLGTFYHSFGNVHLYNGIAPKSDFLRDDANFTEFQRKVAGATERGDFMEIRQWYINNSQAEGEGHERKDHIPFVLEQLSIEPKELPTLEVIANGSFFENIEKPAGEVFKLHGYKPVKWDSKAEMAA